MCKHSSLVDHAACSDMSVLSVHVQSWVQMCKHSSFVEHAACSDMTELSVHVQSWVQIQ